jgi:hypothetical protein
MCTIGSGNNHLRSQDSPANGDNRIDGRRAQMTNRPYQESNPKPSSRPYRNLETTRQWGARTTQALSSDIIINDSIHIHARLSHRRVETSQATFLITANGAVPGKASFSPPPSLSPFPLLSIPPPCDPVLTTPLPFLLCRRQTKLAAYQTCIWFPKRCVPAKTRKAPSPRCVVGWGGGRP